MGLEQTMEDCARRGITVLLKVDHERQDDGGEPWTVLMSGPGVGAAGAFIRAEAATMSEAVNECLHRLAELPGDWSWLHGPVSE